MVSPDYLRRIYEVDEEREGELVVALVEAGTLGVETLEPAGGRLRLLAYFASGDWPAVMLPAGARLVDEARFPPADWMAGYRAVARPLEVGRRFVIDPREPGSDEAPFEPPPGRFHLRVPARSA